MVRGDLDLPKLAVETALDRLSKSRVRCPDMRIEAAEDKRTGPLTLKRLAKSADEVVRFLLG